MAFWASVCAALGLIKVSCWDIETINASGLGSAWARLPINATCTRCASAKSTWRPSMRTRIATGRKFVPMKYNEWICDLRSQNSDVPPDSGIESIESVANDDSNSEVGSWNPVEVKIGPNDRQSHEKQKVRTQNECLMVQSWAELL